jgi:hypothetical protein
MPLTADGVQSKHGPGSPSYARSAKLPYTVRHRSRVAKLVFW